MATKEEVLASLNNRAGLQAGATSVPDLSSMPTAGTQAQYQHIKSLVGALPAEALNAVIKTMFPTHDSFESLQAVFEPNSLVPTSPPKPPSIPAPPAATTPEPPKPPSVPTPPVATIPEPPKPPTPPAPKPEAVIPDGTDFWFEGWFFGFDGEPISEGPCPDKWKEKDGGMFRKDGRGRPPGSTNKQTAEKKQETTLETAVAAVAQVLPAIAESMKQVKEETRNSVGNPIDTLYVKCYPILGALDKTPHPFSEIASKAHEALAKQGMTGHYKTQEFGKGTGFWAMAVQDQIMALGGCDVFVDLASTEALDALSTLERFANKVVRGL